MPLSPPALHERAYFPVQTIRTGLGLLCEPCDRVIYFRDWWGKVQYCTVPRHALRHSTKGWLLNVGYFQLSRSMILIEIKTGRGGFKIYCVSPFKEIE